MGSTYFTWYLSILSRSSSPSSLNLCTKIYVGTSLVSWKGVFWRATQGSSTYVTNKPNQTEQTQYILRGCGSKRGKIYANLTSASKIRAFVYMKPHWIYLTNTLDKCIFPCILLFPIFSKRNLKKRLMKWNGWVN